MNLEKTFITKHTISLFPNDYSLGEYFWKSQKRLGFKSELIKKHSNWTELGASLRKLTITKTK